MSHHRSREALTPAIVPITMEPRRVAGIDLAASEHWVCVNPDLDPKPVRRFEAFTVDIHAMATWLVSLQIVSVAMEATGPYWFQVFRTLTAAGLEVILVDPRQTRNPRNRKTDMLDCQHIWQMHAHGLLSAAFVPGETVQTLRTYIRFRQTRETRLAQAITAMHEALARMNIKLGMVLNDLGGTTGQAIIAAILAGERDPVVLARLRHGRCVADEPTIAKALEGTWREDDLFLLQQAHQDYTAQLAAMAETDQRLKPLLARISPQREQPVPITRKRSTHKTDFNFPAQQAVAALTGIDLAAIDGIGAHTALHLIAEIGFSVAPWPSSRAFCAWLGLCPNPKRSGGRTHGSMPTTAGRAAAILKRAAHGLTGKPGPMGDAFARHAKRKGRTFAIKTAAHRYARIIYAMLSKHTAYDPARLEPVLSQRQRLRQIEHLTRRAQALGLTLTPTAAPATTPAA